MKKYYLAIVTWLFMPIVVFSQQIYSLNKADSVKLEGFSSSVAKIIAFKDERVYVAIQGEGITIYSLNGNKLKRIQFRQKKRKWFKVVEEPCLLHEPSIILYKNDYVFNWSGYISVFDSTGLLRLKTEIWNKKDYKSQYINGIRVEFIGAESSLPNSLFRNDTMITPLRALAFLKSPKSKTEREKVKYDWLLRYTVTGATDTMDILPSYPLFNLYRVNFNSSKGDSEHSFPVKDSQGNQIDLIRPLGKIDSIWSETIKQGAFYRDAEQVLFTFDSIKKHIITGNSVFPQMKVYNFAGNIVKTFGERGRHILDTDMPYKIIKKELIDSLKQKSPYGIPKYLHTYGMVKIFASLFYQEMVYDAIHNRTYRTYYRPVPYSEGELWQMANGKEELREKFNDSLRLLRPCYLQIYDHNDGDKLIYDERVPAPFYILEVKGDTLWAVAGTTDKGLKIVKYHLKKE